MSIRKNVTFIVLSFTLFIFSSCSLRPGHYREAVRFSENSSPSFEQKWQHQLLSDQHVGYESGTSHPYYVLFYSKDFKKIDTRNMVAQVDISMNDAEPTHLQNVPLARFANNKAWAGVFYLPSDLDETAKAKVEFHLKNVLGEYRKCYDSSFHHCYTDWKSVSLIDQGYDNSASDTYSDPFAIIANGTSITCGQREQILFLEHGNTPALVGTSNDCSLKTKVSGFSDNYDLYVKNEAFDSAEFSTQFTIYSDGEYLAGPFSLSLSNAGGGWSMASNILNTTDGITARSNSELASINMIRNGAYKNITFVLSNGANLTVTMLEQSSHHENHGHHHNSYHHHGNSATSTSVTQTISVINGLAAATSDPFSIRPDHFRLSPSNANSAIMPSTIIAADEYNISIQAQGIRNSIAHGYTTTLTDANVIPSITAVSGRTCNTPNVNVNDIVFENADAVLENFSVNNISDSAMALQIDIRDSSWSAIDQPNDCIEDSSSNTPIHGKVGCDVALVTPLAIANVKPATFAINSTIKDAKDENWTYLDASMHQSLDANLTLHALSSKNEIVSNFDAECLAKDINITIPYSYANAANLNLKYMYAFKNSDGNWGTTISKENSSRVQLLQVNIPASNFFNGEAFIKGSLNFARSKQVPLNPFNLYFAEANITDVNDDINVSDVALSTENHLFVYGASQVRVESNRTNSRLKRAVVSYDVYCNRRCQRDSELKRELAQHFGLNSTAQLKREQGSLWWIHNPQHQIFTIENGNFIPKHGGVTQVNGVTIPFNATKLLASSVRKNHILSTIYHENNRTIINALYDGRSGYPFQKSIDIAVSPWLQNNRYGTAGISHRIDLRFVKESQGSGDTNRSRSVDMKVKEENSRRVFW